LLFYQYPIRRKTFTVGYYAIELITKNLKYGFTKRALPFQAGFFVCQAEAPEGQHVSSSSSPKTTPFFSASPIGATCSSILHAAPMGLVVLDIH